MRDIIKDSALVLAEKIRCGEIKIAEVLDAVYESEKQNKELNCFITLCRERAYSKGTEIQKRIDAGEYISPLAGVPIGIKDNIAVKDVKMTCGSRMLENYVPPVSAAAVEKLEKAGLIIVGKLNMDEFAMGSTGETSYYGAVLNPVDKTRVPGGSSSGAAAAVAAGIVPLALGSDTGGSVRQPAAFCGIFGFKPTYGTVSRNGLVAYASSFDQIGAIARNASDCAALAAIISGRDCGDSTTEDTAPVRSDFVESYSLCGKIIGVPNEFVDNCGEDIRSAVNNALKKAESLGARVEYFSLPPLKFAVPAYYIIACAQASSNLARYDGVRFGRRAQNSDDLIKMYIKSRSEGFGREVRRRIMLGNFVLSAGYYDAYYNKALRARRVIRDTLSDAFKKYDFIAGAVYPSTAPKLGESLDDPLKTYIGDAYTVPANLAGLPAISVPCGKTAALQLMAAPFADENLLGAARCLTL
jgi:aspartyl-tRNA(Asn)/glutamyl-tRNA(Gln) amidotransferase subunit A